MEIDLAFLPHFLTSSTNRHALECRIRICVHFVHTTPAWGIPPAPRFWQTAPDPPADEEHARTGAAARCYRDFSYQTRSSWSRRRRVVGKAEYLAKGPNPRFVVTSLSRQRIRDRRLYERLYCGRGEMENRIKEQQLWLFADRTSTAKLRANQLRLTFSSLAYVLVMTVRRVGLAGTGWARAQAGTIRTLLLKLGAQVRVSVRRVWFSFSSGYPSMELFRTVQANLQAAYPLGQ